MTPEKKEWFLYILMWFICLLFILIKGNLMNHWMTPILYLDLVIILIAYILAFQGEAKAGIFCFGQGLLTDTFSAGLPGIFTLLYLIIFLGVHVGSRIFDLRSTRGLMIIVLLAVLLKEVLFLALLDIFSLEFVFSSSILVSIALSAVCSGLAAPFVFYVFNQMSILIVGDIEETL